jgi:hypothetical protein
MEMKWSDVPDASRSAVLIALRFLPYLDLFDFIATIKKVESMQLPWRENNDLVEQIFITLAREISKEVNLEILQRRKDLIVEVYELLDFCVSRIDHSMLSSIIAK